MKFFNYKLFAEMKKCSRQTVYSAENKGEIVIDRSQGFPVVYVTDKNLTWQSGKIIGRHQKEIKSISKYHFSKP